MDAGIFTGPAAGTAAPLAVRYNKSPLKLDVKLPQDTLGKQGVLIRVKYLAKSL